ncbi:unnamed protein product [Rotaria sordida]|uniref:Uncharacterized protein n=1 Tax=Rotaria sordida TaxID=392033 RepID=A0A815HVK9_9BILA|nr:unnamed protein product [Rotaria sordida]CAF1394394.1 unnamed protein product [Rotaria sordida]
MHSMGHLFLIITNKNYTIVLLDVENIDGRTDESIYNRTNASGKEDECIEIMEDKHSEKFTTADDNETMEINDEKLNHNGIIAIDKQVKKQLNINDSEKDNNNLQGCVKRNTVLTDSSVSGEESIANNSISPQNNHLKRAAIDENDFSSNDGIVSRAIEEQVRNVVEHSCSPIAGKTDSSITIETRN